MGMRESGEKHLKYKLFSSLHGLLVLITDFTNILPSLHSKTHCVDVQLGNGLLQAQEMSFLLKQKHMREHIYIRRVYPQL